MIAEICHCGRLNTITNIEVGRYKADSATLQKIEVFYAEGIEFIDENGGGVGGRVRKRQKQKTPK